MVGFSDLIIFFTLCLGSNTLFGAKVQARVRTFPPNFIFGSATASYQVEGAWNADGKGPNIWDTFTHNFPDRIEDSSTGDIACDSYNLYKEDVALLKSLGAQFYRFSFSWSRLMPNGDISSLNQAGVDYYHRLLDELINNGIEPMATMYHWDLPQYLQDLGGFANPLIIEWFESYANFLFREYGNKIKFWITFNEVRVFCSAGYDNELAPALNSTGVGEYLCVHHVLQAHARTYHLYKNYYFIIQQGKVGITLDIKYGYPKDPNNEDHVATTKRYMQFELGLYANAIYSPDGDYPPIVREIVDKNSVVEGRERTCLPKFTLQMVDYIKGSADFFGLNYYTSRIIEPEDPDMFPIPSRARDAAVVWTADPTWIREESDLLYSVPVGLRDTLNWIKNNYGDIPIIITENGWKDHGTLEDDPRITYLNAHYNAVLDAIDDGVNVVGHAVWSLIDNFEWVLGYTVKYGITRVDQNDPARTRVEKKSFSFVKEVFRTRQISDHL